MGPIRGLAPCPYRLRPLTRPYGGGHPASRPLPTPKTTKAASGLPGRPFARLSRAKIRLGRASHVLEPAIDARHFGRTRIPAPWKRMDARAPRCLEQLGFGLGSQCQGQHGGSSSWTAKGGRAFMSSLRFDEGQETKRIDGNTQWRHMWLRADLSDLASRTVTEPVQLLVTSRLGAGRAASRPSCRGNASLSAFSPVSDSRLDS